MTPRLIYNSSFSDTLSNIAGISLDFDDLYWTNSDNGPQIGALHKAFSEPYIKGVPLFNFQIGGFVGITNI